MAAAGLYELRERGKLIGAFSVKELAKMLEVSEGSIRNAASSGWKIKEQFEISPPNAWRTEKVRQEWMADWEEKWNEARFAVNPKIAPVQVVPENEGRQKKAEKTRNAAVRHSIRYSATAVRFY